MIVPVGFLEKIAVIIESGRHFVGRTANLAICITYFEVGKMIVEEDQNCKERAEYGKTLIRELSKYLKGYICKGFSETNLKNTRLFDQTYSSSILKALSDEMKNYCLFTTAQQLNNVFKLSWSHYLCLTKIKNENEIVFFKLSQRIIGLLGN